LRVSASALMVLPLLGDDDAGIADGVVAAAAVGVGVGGIVWFGGVAELLMLVLLLEVVLLLFLSKHRAGGVRVTSKVLGRRQGGAPRR